MTRLAFFVPTLLVASLFAAPAEVERGLDTLAKGARTAEAVLQLAVDRTVEHLMANERIQAAVERVNGALGAGEAD